MDLLDQMTTFVRVVDSGSFSAAAKQRRLSSAAVSRQIAALETELGISLVRRSTRKMTITAEGRKYYERCLRVLQEVDDAQSIAKGEAIDGLLRVSAPVTFGLARVVPHLHGLLTAQPGLRVDLRLEDRLVDLALEGVDVAIRVGAPPPDRADLIAHRLHTFRRALVAAPSYLARRGEPATPEALLKHDTLGFSADDRLNTWRLTDGDRRLELPIRGGVFNSNALHALLELAIRGVGIAQLPEFLIADAVRAGTLTLVLPRWRTEALEVNALVRIRQRRAPQIRAFIEHYRAAYRGATDAADRHAADRLTPIPMIDV